MNHIIGKGVQTMGVFKVSFRVGGETASALFFPRDARTAATTFVLLHLEEELERVGLHSSCGKFLGAKAGNFLNHVFRMTRDKSTLKVKALTLGDVSVKVERVQ
jgi:hypothetical protein